MNVDFGEFPIARYRAHDCPLLDDAKAFVGEAALYQLEQYLLAFQRSRPSLYDAGKELSGSLDFWEFQSRNL